MTVHVRGTDVPASCKNTSPAPTRLLADLAARHSFVGLPEILGSSDH